MLQTLGLAAAFLISSSRPSITSGSQVAVGYSQNAPQMFRDSTGQPRGFVVEALAEAARREDIGINWVFLQPGETPEALRSGRIDLWPAGVSTPARRKEFHLTPPWWKGDMLILSRNLQYWADLNGRRIGYTPVHASAIQTQFPQVTPVQMPNLTDLAEAMCKGKLDGVLMDRLVLDSILLNRPPVCSGLSLEILGAGVSSELGIISRKDRARVADRLEQRLDELKSDGSLAKIALSYPRIAAGSANFLTAIVEQHYRLQFLRAAALVLLALSVLGVLFILRMRSDLQRLRRVEAQVRNRNSDLREFALASHHDLREPLRNMAIFSQLLQKKCLDQPEALEYLSYIAGGAERMQEMLDGVRRYTQMEMNEAPRPELVDAGLAVAEARANLPLQIQEAEATIVVGRMPVVPCVKEQLTQIMQNLISNALKYRSALPPVIRIECQETPTEHIFSVEDNGVGIPPEYQERIFGLFKRLHDGSIPGTGLGLAICRKMVEMNGGRIWVESEPGKGSRFCFTVPRPRQRMMRRSRSFVATLAE